MKYLALLLHQIIQLLSECVKRELLPDSLLSLLPHLGDVGLSFVHKSLHGPRKFLWIGITKQSTGFMNHSLCRATIIDRDDRESRKSFFKI